MEKRTTVLPAAALAAKELQVTTADNEATIWLYGYVGERYEYDYDEGRYDQVGITDLGFVKELNALAEVHQVIHLRINSLGGSMFHGNAILTAIANCKAEVHTWNDGCAASMAADIWMCGHQRHMARNAMLMIHPVSMACWGNADALREAANYCDKSTEATIIACSESLGISADEMRQRYYANGKDVWLNYADAVADGLLTDDTAGTEYNSETPLPADAVKLTYSQLLKQYTPPAEDPEPSWLQKFVKMFTQAPTEGDGDRLPRMKNPPPPPPLPEKKAANTQPNNVTLEQFNEALTSNSISVADAEAALAAHKQATAPPPDYAVLTQKMAQMERELNALKQAPGAPATTPPAPPADPASGGEPAGTPLSEGAKAFEDTLDTALKVGVNPFRVGIHQG